MDRIARAYLMRRGSSSRTSWAVWARLLAVGMLGLCGCGASVHEAVARGDLESVRRAAREDIRAFDVRDRLQKTPLHHAVTFHRPEAVALLIELGSSLNAADRTGMTPLHTAAMLGRSGEARLLLAAGADVDAADSFGDTPLHTAAIFGAADVIEVLSKHGASLVARNSAGKTALELATEYDQVRAVFRIRRIE